MDFSKVLGFLAVVIATLCMIEGDAVSSFIVLMLVLMDNKLGNQSKDS